jgi:hypothetical protein
MPILMMLCSSFSGSNTRGVIAGGTSRRGPRWPRAWDREGHAPGLGEPRSGGRRSHAVEPGKQRQGAKGAAPGAGGAALGAKAATPEGAEGPRRRGAGSARRGVRGAHTHGRRRGHTQGREGEEEEERERERGEGIGAHLEDPNPAITVTKSQGTTGKRERWERGNCAREKLNEGERDKRGAPGGGTGARGLGLG